jgi:hypothetical protein
MCRTEHAKEHIEARGMLQHEKHVSGIEKNLTQLLQDRIKKAKRTNTHVKREDKLQVAWSREELG